jgi:DNA-binding MarR family transcriptional regulator
MPMGDEVPPVTDEAGGAEPVGLGAALRGAWVGYQHRLDKELLAAGFDRRFPDGRVLRLCGSATGSTISEVGRGLGITRQGAAKIVSSLAERGFLTVTPSETSGREKTARLTPHARRYLAVRRAAARRVEADLRAALGPETFDGLRRLLAALGADADERASDYLRRRSTPAAADWPTS